MTVIAKSGKSQPEEITPERLKAIVADFQTKLKNANIDAIFSALFGGEENLSAFSDTKGLGIGAFAKLVGLIWA
jgi:hypothetical protein